MNDDATNADRLTTSSSNSDENGGPTQPYDPSDGRARSGSGRLEVRCPSCHTPIEVAVDTLLTDLTCSVCGSHFSLVDQSQTTRVAPTLSKLGRFELIERLGIGGYGSVWKARDKELDRTVAIKIPRAGVMTAEEQEKFFREARAAAQLRHPSIVSVHEVGRDGDSVYIVSDFVRGVTLGDWLTGQQLTGREAAELCAKIADALDHAHEQGVVHRDLKPANIMIDGEGDPHLMDFGLARREVGEVTVTLDGQVLGTPAYMSPEQAQGEAHTADRRSDVYSLGVILFQLLTGELPFRGNARMLMHQVINDEPPSPRTLNGNIPRDLETVTLKCLEKTPARRYQSARDLIDELRRFLAGEPILARPVSRIERASRWIGRNPTVAVLSAEIILLLVAGTVVSTLFAIDNRRKAVVAIEREHDALVVKKQADEARLTALARQKEAEAARAEEVLARKNAQAVTDFFGEAFVRTNPEIDGRKVTVAEVLDRVEKQLDQRLADQPLTQAAVLIAIGQARTGLGLLFAAVDPLQKAARLREEALGIDHQDTLAAKQQLASAYNGMSHTNEALRVNEETVAALQAKLGPDHPLTLEWNMSLASAFGHRGRGEDAIRLSEKTLAAMRQKLGADHALTLQSMTDVAYAYDTAKRYDEAIRLHKEALAAQQAKLPAGHATILRSKQYLVRAYRHARKFEEAIQLAKEVLAETQKRGVDHPDALDAMNVLATTYHAAGRSGDELELRKDTLAKMREKLGVEHATTLYSMVELASAYYEAGRLDESFQLLDEVLSTKQAVQGINHPDTLTTMGFVAQAYHEAHRLDDTIRVYEKLVPSTREKMGPVHESTLIALHNLAFVYREADRPEDAIRIAQDVVPTMREKLGADHPTTLLAVENLAAAYRSAGRRDDEAKLSLDFGRFALALNRATTSNTSFVDSMIKAAAAQDIAKVPTPNDALVAGELRLVAGELDAAETAIRAAIARGEPPAFMYKSLGWCLLAKGDTSAANEAFERALKQRRRDDGTFDLEGAQPDELTAAYFLGLIDEEAYTARTAEDERLACFPWFYIAQRREIDGNKDAAIAAYERCLELGSGNKSHSVRALAQWRLTKLRAVNESGQK